MKRKYAPFKSFSTMYSKMLALHLLFFLGSHADAQTASKKNVAAPLDSSFDDSHFHLTNYIQEGADIHSVIQIMGNRVKRSTLFGIPLQQMWSYQNSGSYAPTYYLQSDAPLYYYSFTDAYIASVFNSLTPVEKERFDPMITGFNPADMYAKAHVKRVLLTFPGVFSGIGEFSIHKEFVSAKVAGEGASLTNPALDSLLDFAAQVGLVVLIHNDIDMPFAKAGAEPVYLTQMKDLLKRHQNATIIWAHLGLGRIVHPVQASASEPPSERNQSYMQIVEAMLADPELKHVCFDLSWDEVAKYITASPQSIQNTISILNRYPDRFLFGTDVVAPTSPEMYYSMYNKYDALWKGLSPGVSEQLRKGNYERIFNAARLKVRAWEASQKKLLAQAN